MTAIKRWAHWVWHRVDAITALAIAIVVSVGAALGQFGQDFVAVATLSTLALIAFSYLRALSLADRLSDAMERLGGLSEVPRADEFFTHETAEREVVAATGLRLDAVQETGSRLFETSREQLLDLLRSGGSIRAVVCSTAQTGDLLAYRNANLLTPDLDVRAVATQAQLRSLSEAVGDEMRRVEVRHVPYPVDFTLLLSDLGARGRAYVRLAGFRVPYAQKLDFKIDNSSPRTLEHYRAQFESLFLGAYKFVLLEGPPHSGKTTAVDAIVNRLAAAELQHVAYLLTLQDVDEDGQRVGFSIRTSEAPDVVRTFASRRDDGSYDVDEAVLQDACRYVRSSAAEGRVIILDEIGPLQLRSPMFRELMRDLEANINLSIIATIAAVDDPSIIEIKRSPRTTIYAIGGNEYNSKDRVLDEVRSAIRTREILGSRS